MSFIYRTDWHRMAAYDTDRENIEWHVSNCMNYIILRSEEVEPNWVCPPDMNIDPEDWNELELLALYQDLIEPAVQAGYCADAGMVTRIKKAFSARIIK